MSRAYLFNPANDIALIRDTPVFTPGANALRLQRDGAILPLWMASAGDCVIAPDTDRRWLDTVRDLYDLPGDVCATVPGHITEGAPWGWSRNAVRLLTDAGMTRELLPDDTVLARRRALSHRRTAIRINAALAEQLAMPLPPPAIEAFDTDTVFKAVAGYGGDAVIKAPYSSSGRGIIDTRTCRQSQLAAMLPGLLRRQGSVTVEHALDRIEDFAMLFEMRGGVARLCGLSQFETAGGAYTGNILVSDDVIRQHIMQQTDDGMYERVAALMPGILADILGDACDGPCGVDMMAYRDSDGTRRLAPCIELNLRMTMGVFAHIWRRRHLADGVPALFTIRYTGPDNKRSGKETGKGSGKGSVKECDTPIVESHRLVRGTQRLTPPSTAFAITVTTT